MYMYMYVFVCMYVYIYIHIHTCGFDSQGTHILMKMFNLNAIVSVSRFG